MKKPLWITYAWADNEQGDFDHLVVSLERIGVPVVFDKRELIPGQRLWTQIDQKIRSDELAGWAYLVTRASLASQPCLEELAYALNQALQCKGGSFPLIGLLADVAIGELPQSLQTRLCVSLSSSNWPEEVLAGVERRAPNSDVIDPGPFRIVVHSPYLGSPAQSAIEIQSRFGSFRYWRIASPSNGPELVRAGIGPEGGRGVSSATSNYLDGQIELENIQCKFIGAGDPITPGSSAYGIYKGGLPVKVYLGIADEAFGIPSKWMGIQIR